MSGGGFVFGLVGWPLTRSLSPSLHAVALRASGLSGAYRCFPVPPNSARDSELQALILRMRTGEVHGLNVTTPHKAAVLPFLDGVTDRASAIGAANTLYPDGKRIMGDNTDAEGFLRDLQSRFALRPGQALVLGAGGAARAAVFALAQADWIVHVAGRTFSRARRLAHDLSASTGGPVFAHRLDRRSLARLSPELTLLVQATPAGSASAPEATPWPSGLPLPSNAVVYDLVYSPVETALMRLARLAGLPSVGGLGMLIEQAALSFERWTGRSAPRGPMRRAVGLPSARHEE